MFTGLIETVGTIRSVRRSSGSAALVVESDLPVEHMADGESVAVQGACLTVVRREPPRFQATAVAETLRLTTLGALRAGSRVNLERSLRLSDRLGGHLVQGHVDGTARVLEVRARADDWRVRIETPPALARFVARKGSIAVDGVSLTVAEVDAGGFEVALIPETLARTTLRDLRSGGHVNLEVDLIARYLESLMGGRFA